MASKRAGKERIRTNVGGGVVQGFVGTESVRIENLNFYGSALPAEPSREIDEGTLPPCPYPGLAYFGPKDSALFFGRNTAIARLETAVTRQALTALVGASGSGKSSVVLAGLAPRLNVQRGWRFSHFRVGTEPSKNPFLALARALVPLLGEHGPIDQIEEVQKLAGKLETGAVDLSGVMGACRASNPGRRILLIADQFEEVFTLVNDEVIRHRFIDGLLAGFRERSDGGAPDISLVLTLRADFYGMALRNRPLADVLQGRLENLGPMTREELREAIVRPAGVVTFEDGLVDTLLDDVDSRPGSLPLLQFALREMWERLDKRRMTRAVYEMIGGVEGALAQRADAIYDALTAKGENTHAVSVFRRLFTRLVALGEGGAGDTRRIVGREELGPEAWALAQRLAGEDNRLIVTSAPVPDRETAEVLHEALIRTWPKLIEWLDRDRTFQSWLRQLKPRVDEWRNHPDDEGALLRGGALALAKDWLERRDDEFSENERTYIDRSVEHERQARIRSRRVQSLIYVLLFGIIAGLLGWINQAYVKEQLNWYTTMRPYRIAHVDPYVLKAEAERALKPLASFRECAKDCPEMIVIPAGSFTMGSPPTENGRWNEGPQHKVTIAKAFAVSKFEVTFADWDACVSVGGCPQEGRAGDAGWGRGTRPVIYVSWDDAQQYVAWLSKLTGKRYRLLSEAEWEYTARAGTTTRYSFEGDEAVLGEYAWHGENANNRSQPVGQKKANAFGLNDVHGNVSEWVEDCYNDGYNGAPTDGSAWTSGYCKTRVVRGGGGPSLPRDLRSAYRTWDYTGSRNARFGFRLGRTLTP
jgi:formylglycine-generating enzyme required for sulfatase activity